MSSNLGAAEDAELEWLPRCPPHPTPEALSRSCPIADLGHFSLLLFGLCNFTGTAVSSHKEYKDSRALRIYFLYYESL